MKKWTSINTFSLLLILIPCLAGFMIPELDDISPWYRITWQWILPLTLAAGYLLTIYCFNKDPVNNRADSKNRPLYEKATMIEPILFLACEVFSLYPLFGLQLSSGSFLNILFGILFLVIGNMLGKIEQNETFGIRTTWALQNRDNWNYTNRMTGRCWVLCGCVFLFALFLPNSLWLTILTIVTLTVYPVLVSWSYARKQKEDGTWTDDSPTSNPNLQKSLKKSAWLTGGLFVLIAVFVGAVVFLGNFSVTWSNDTLQIDARMESGMTIPASEIKSVSLIETPKGEKIVGFGTSTLKMGTYESPGLGHFRRYTWGSSDKSIKIQTPSKLVIINEKTPEETEALYQTIKQSLNK